MNQCIHMKPKLNSADFVMEESTNQEVGGK
jgi:hypothetical protein